MQPPVRDLAYGINLFYFLADGKCIRSIQDQISDHAIVTKEIGGTLIMPGSHKGQIAPVDLRDTSDFISVEGPAGTCMILDGRTWHSTGRNTVPGSERPIIIAFFTRKSILENESFYLSIRPNAFFSVAPQVEANMTDRVRKWIAWKDDSGLAGYNMSVRRQQDPIGRLG
jgi:hypothetical protein